MRKATTKRGSIDKVQTLMPHKRPLGIADGEYEKLRAGIYHTWSMIGHEVGEATRLEAMEITLDANYMSSYGHKEAEKIVDKLIDTHGYPKVLRELAKLFPL